MTWILILDPSHDCIHGCKRQKWHIKSAPVLGTSRGEEEDEAQWEAARKSKGLVLCG